MLDLMVGAYPTFEELPGTIRDWEHEFFYFALRCRLVSKATGETLAEGIGSCNSRENRYASRWQFPNQVPAHLDKDGLKKREGTDRRGQRYIQYLVPNEDIATLVNTIEKMAQKRAHVAATLNATGASRIFTQDVEDMTPEAAQVKPSPPGPPPAVPKAPAETSAAATSGAKDDYTYWSEEIGRQATVADLHRCKDRIIAARLAREVAQQLNRIYATRLDELNPASPPPKAEETPKDAEPGDAGELAEVLG